eukprot:COSAG06_NODE_1619_length_8908_cov_3.222727_6_plen_150_part_00
MNATEAASVFEPLCIELDQFSPLEATEKYCRELFAVDRSASQPVRHIEHRKTTCSDADTTTATVAIAIVCCRRSCCCCVPFCVPLLPLFFFLIGLARIACSHLRVSGAKAARDQAADIAEKAALEKEEEERALKKQAEEDGISVEELKE